MEWFVAILVFPFCDMISNGKFEFLNIFLYLKLFGIKLKSSIISNPTQNNVPIITDIFVFLITGTFFIYKIVYTTPIKIIIDIEIMFLYPLFLLDFIRYIIATTIKHRIQATIIKYPILWL